MLVLVVVVVVVLVVALVRLVSAFVDLFRARRVYSVLPLQPVVVLVRLWTFSGRGRCIASYPCSLWWRWSVCGPFQGWRGVARPIAAVSPVQSPSQQGRQ
eukprot:COSAG02_NODE_1416_length_12734_cov_9.649545_3_plen_100_part_00